METPKLLITSISQKNIDHELMPSNLALDFEIGVRGLGDFTKYIDKDQIFNTSKLLSDIFQGEISIVAYDQLETSTAGIDAMKAAEKLRKILLILNEE